MWAQRERKSALEMGFNGRERGLSQAGTLWGFPGGSAVKNLPAVQEPQKTWVQSLDWEVPLEGGMATHSSNLAWRIPWIEESCGLQSIGSQRAGHN